MRSRLPALLVAVLVVLGPGASKIQASCVDYTPMYHGLDSYFLCNDFGPAGAYSYQQSDATGVNSGGVEIQCIAPGSDHCSGSGSGLPGDGRLTIETAWSNPGIIGCPLAPSPQRVNIVVSSGGFISGSALIVSLSGTNPSVGYLVEAAHPFDPATGLVVPLSCGPTVQQFGTGGATVNLRFTLPPVHTDCDPDAIGVLYLESCQDAFSPTLSFGQVYTQVRPCSSRVDVRRGSWTGTGVVPAADGSATITVDASPPGYCTLIGSTTVVNGVETGSITGFVLSSVDCTDSDADGYTNCEGDCDDHNAAVHPGATETCNNIDDDCDRETDEGFDSDGDTVADCFDNCPSVANIGQADRDGDSVGDVCDNCLEVPNPDQRDMDNDGYGDVCDNCPTIPNANQDGCVCDNCDRPFVTISFSSKLSKGSGLVTWNSASESDVLGFNIVELTHKGERIQLNQVLIPCEECVTGLGHIYSFIIPKHKSGRNIFIEMLRVNGTIQTFGPAIRI